MILNFNFNFSKVPSYAPWWWSKGTETCRSHIRRYLNTNCSILYFNEKCICWQNSFVLIKMNGKTTIKTSSDLYFILVVNIYQPTFFTAYITVVSHMPVSVGRGAILSTDSANVKKVTLKRKRQWAWRQYRRKNPHVVKNACDIHCDKRWLCVLKYWTHEICKTCRR